MASTLFSRTLLAAMAKTMSASKPTCDVARVNNGVSWMHSSAKSRA